MSETHPVPARCSKDAHVSTMAKYKSMYDESIKDPTTFFSREAKKMLSWMHPFDAVMSGSFRHGDISWFPGGRINVSANCLDRHPADRVAIIWEGDETKDVRHVTYGEALRETCKVANALIAAGVQKGDRVAIYMPMVPEAAFAMLACTRIGAIHSVVFAGFSAEALRARIVDAKCKAVITADQGLRGGKVIPLKHTVDEALSHDDCQCVTAVFVHRRTNRKVPMREHRDHYLDEACASQRPVCPAVPMESEDPMYLLYTSGSTGKPKGVMHTTGGYLLWAAMTHHYVFDYHVGDVYACVADIGWVTGHSYIVYGPLANGGTTFMFESLPTYPDAGRYWDMVQRHKITQFYTAPTAIRALMKAGVDPVKKHDRSSLRVLGSVGEPINPEAWKWYFEEVGDKQCAIVDTFWQTETGGHMLTGLPGCTPMKPGAASFPFFGVLPVVLDPTTGQECPGNEVEGVLVVQKPWPGMARSIYGDHKRYLETYMQPYPGSYFTGDGCRRDADGYYWITGRVDDVLNVSGHRLGTAEIESALVEHPACVEAAVVGIPHDIKVRCGLRPRPPPCFGRRLLCRLEGTRSRGRAGPVSARCALPLGDRAPGRTRSPAQVSPTSVSPALSPPPPPSPAATLSRTLSRARAWASLPTASSPTATTSRTSSSGSSRALCARASEASRRPRRSSASPGCPRRARARSCAG
jgi:acetyl-CoA synthetase